MRCLRLVVSLLVLALPACGAEEGGEPAPPPRRPAPPAAVSPRSPPGAIRLAAIFPTSGRYEASGRESLRGARLAVDIVRRSGGERSRRLFLVDYPTRSDVESTEEAAWRAVAEGAVALIGSNASLLSKSVARVAEAAEVVMITNVSTATDLTLGRPFVFRTCYSNDYLARLLARFVWDDLNGRRVAVLQEVSRPYSKDLGDRFSHHFGALIAARHAGAIRTWQYVAREPDFTPHLDAIRDFGADILFLPSSFDDATLVALHVRAMKLELTMVGGDSWASARLFNRGGPGRPAYHSDHWNPTPDNRFLAAYRARYGRPPDGGRAALAHDAVLAVARAIERMGGPCRAEDLAGPGLARLRRRLPQALREVRITGATGSITFDREGNARKPCFVFRVDGKRRVLAATLR